MYPKPIHKTIDRCIPFDFLLCLPKTDPIYIIPEMVRMMMLRQLPFIQSSVMHCLVDEYLPLSICHSGMNFPFYDSFDNLNSYRTQWRQDEKECEWRHSMAVDNSNPCYK